jgi:hypothetical protein
MKKNMLLITGALIFSQAALFAQDQGKVVTLPEIRISSIALTEPKVADAFKKAFQMRKTSAGTSMIKNI